MAQNQNKTETTLVTSMKELYKILKCPGTEVQNFIFPNDDMVCVSWKYTEDNIATRKNVNVAVAGYVTTQARLKLYKYLSELVESVLFCDTYSAVYVQNIDEPPKLKTGNYQGQLTKELEEFGYRSLLKNLFQVPQRTMRFLCSTPREEDIKLNARGRVKASITKIQSL